MNDIRKTSLSAAGLIMAGLAYATVMLLAGADATGAPPAGANAAAGDTPPLRVLAPRRLPPAAANAAADDTLTQRAAAAERDGRWREAAAAYTALLEQDDAFEPVVAPRLVSLYTRMGETVQALAWATRVARCHPQPAAYLGGVYARLGLYPDAKAALRQALREAPDATRRMPLLWQLAETQEQAGEPAAARETLLLARREASDDARRAVASRRLDALARRQCGNTAPSPAEKREDRP